MTFSIEQFRLDGKVAIVTGAGGRGNSIGRAYALGLAGAGAAVVVADINADGAKRVADEIAANGGKASAVCVDITDPASAKAMVAAATAAFGGVDILVNNAALMAELGHLSLADVPLDEWNRTLNVNLTGALICCQAAIPAMRARGGGRIINQTSGGAFPAIGVYGIGKLALVGLTTTLAKQLGKEGITANAIAPGNVTSDAGKQLVPDDSPFLQLLNMTVASRPRGDG
jgi:NAD(P)-dependent dehydrogenase (short-subunit alcohol dehydrogenase family)